MEIKRVDITVKGLVQGVGFRYFTLRMAKRLPIRGFVKNLSNGDVFVCAEGEKEELEKFIGQLKVGPPSAYVEKVLVEWGDPIGEFTDFEIRY